MSNHKASHECLQQNYIFTANKQLLDHTVTDFVGPATTTSVSSVLKNQVQFFHDFPTAEKGAPALKKGTNESKSLFITSSRFHKVTLVQSFSLKWSKLDTIYYNIIQRHKSYEELARFCG